MTTLRDLIERPSMTLQGVVFDALSAYLAAEAGFETLLLGGCALGQSLMVPDPLLSLEDVAQASRYITQSTGVPVAVDAAAGWGNASHAANAMRVLEQAGAAAVLLEDQIFPRSLVDDRVSALIPVDEMEQKLRAACDVRRSRETLVIARCGALITDGYEGMLERARRYAVAGADVVQIHPPPRSDEETRRAPRDLPGVPLSYINSEPNRYGGGVHPASQLQEWGWKLLLVGPAALAAAAGAMRDVYAHARATGTSGIDAGRMRELRRLVDDAIHTHPGYAVARQHEPRSLSSINR